MQEIAQELTRSFNETHEKEERRRVVWKNKKKVDKRFFILYYILCFLGVVSVTTSFANSLHILLAFSFGLIAGYLAYDYNALPLLAIFYSMYVMINIFFIFGYDYFFSGDAESKANMALWILGAWLTAICDKFLSMKLEYMRIDN